mmetsp:Transcript_59168/g.169948  ORF Transcript_59168/g.169948 Transcript_59168/m.169948 type:complete len:213 (+) Transcript_59168:790-1428(+)
MEGRSLRLEERRAGLLRVAAHACAVLLEIDRDPAGTHGLHLVTDVTHIPRAHHGSQSLGGAHGGKTSHATAKDHGVGRRVLSSRRDFRGMEPLESVGGLEDGAVARKLGLRGEHVQFLCDGDPRHCRGVDELHVCLGRRLDNLLPRRQQAADPSDHGLATKLREVIVHWRVDREENLAIVDHGGPVFDHTTSRHILRIREARFGSGARLHVH